MKLVGLTGRAGAGKSFVAREIMAIEQRSRLVSFAGQLRKEIEGVFGVGHIKRLWDKPTSPEIRALLQWYGTDYRRAEDPDYWVKRAMSEARPLQFDNYLVVFDDVRFPNEAKAIQETGGIVIRVDTPADTRLQRVGKVPEHASETAMDDQYVDCVVSGIGSLAHDKQIREILVEVAYMDIDFLEAVNESLAHRE